MIRTAHFSLDRKYRYELGRDWERNGKILVYIGTNPSYADDKIDDPTIRRMIGFAKEWGYGGIRVLNLMAFIATKPFEMFMVNDPVGIENTRTLLKYKDAPAVACWGAFDSLRAVEMAKFVSVQYRKLYCLGVNKNGSPKHPLYLPKNTVLIPFKYSWV